MNIIHENCEKKVSEDKKLPKSSYLVTYVAKEKLSYDIVMADSKAEIFDTYYDKYKNVKEIKWTKGIISPRTYDGSVQSPAPKKKAKRK